MCQILKQYGEHRQREERAAQAAVANVTGGGMQFAFSASDKKQMFTTTDGTFSLIQISDRAKHKQDLEDSLPLLRLLGNTPRYLAYFGPGGYHIDATKIRSLLASTQNQVPLPTWAGASSMIGRVVTFPAYKDIKKFECLLKLDFCLFKRGQRPSLSLQEFVDPSIAFSPDNHQHLQLGLEGLGIMIEVIAGSSGIGLDCLSATRAEMVKGNILINFCPPKIIHLALTEAMARFSQEMKMDSSGVLGDPSAFPFRLRHQETGLITREKLEAGLLGALHLDVLRNLQPNLNFEHRMEAMK
jgi:hypothetical protein